MWVCGATVFLPSILFENEGLHSESEFCETLSAKELFDKVVDSLSKIDASTTTIDFVTLSEILSDLRKMNAGESI